MKAFLLLFLLAAATVDAAGIGVAPSELHFSVLEGRTQERELTVYNLNMAGATISAESSSDFVSIEKTAALEAGSSAKLAVEADASSLKPGNHEATIYLTTAGSAGGVALNIGTAVKATLSVIPLSRASILVGLFTSAAVVIAGLGLYFASLRAIRLLRPAKA